MYSNVIIYLEGHKEEDSLKIIKETEILSEFLLKKYKKTKDFDCTILLLPIILLNKFKKYEIEIILNKYILRENLNT